MPSSPRFVHLHLHTDYSLLDGACEIKQLAEEAARRGMPAVAVTDHGNLFAAQNFYYEATTRGVKPIVGCEVYVAKGSRHDRGTELASQRDAARANGGMKPNALTKLNASKTNGSGPGKGGPRTAQANPATAAQIISCCSAKTPKATRI